AAPSGTSALSLPDALPIFDVEEERHVRFGRALFMNDCGTNAPVPRASVDDVLATYIEEMGHSWQEYYYETEGRGEGPRTRQTLRSEEHTSELQSRENLVCR